METIVKTNVCNCHEPHLMLGALWYPSPGNQMLGSKVLSSFVLGLSRGQESGDYISEVYVTLTLKGNSALRRKCE